ncbi:hypothetical protein TREMEDRAFT_31415, partial [Tremella mesenterica DSM 1558]|uniref:uncharacterized protein n=1 Tax=Tremella mesenterica (strain ATCC 24925 / CBS 8224 / DSM 1558 / NBRC 9311 / NRRL Y-6157 / RJB 2259-6 / UBC 559-6) TaxID=578456 RepID=UPI0003F49413
PVNNDESLTAKAIWAPKEGEWVSPEDDPEARRGIPVFRPTMEEFKDFEGYVERTTPWGQRSGIVKIIPPAEWVASLPPIPPNQLADVRISSPIQQQLHGQTGLFRVINVEKNRLRPLSVKEWYHKAQSAKYAGPGPKMVDPIRDRDTEQGKQVRAAREAERQSRNEKRRNDNKRRKEAKEAREAQERSIQVDEEHLSEPGPSRAPSPELVKVEDTSMKDDEASTTETPLQPLSQLETTSVTSPVTKTKNGSKEEKWKADLPWYEGFKPSEDWLPEDTSAADYTPEACKEMAKKWWRRLGQAEAAWYGADLQGSLFQDKATPWNVSCLPNLLNRCNLTKQLPGVNTPYLYFGMWGATFAWHVEDMDLFSINYIHFGAPKFWYAVPQVQAERFERTIAQYFPVEARTCDQFLRHKAFTLSPTRLAEQQIRVNMLVQHQNEFVITYPRGYHAGFNMGFNCAESINFALESWVELGRRAKVCECVSHSVRIDVDEMLAERELVEAIDNERSAKKKRSRISTDTPTSKRPRTSTVFPEDASQSDETEEPEHESKLPISGMEKSKKATHISKPRPPAIKKEIPSYPCLFCPSLSQEGLTMVEGANEVVQARSKSRVPGLFAHRSCALAIPETSVDDREVDGKLVGVIANVNAIPTDRWNLKCTACTDRKLAAIGAKVQCTKGKCPRAFHVSCANAAEDVVFEVLEVQEWVPLPLPDDAPPGTQHEFEQVNSIKVNCLCPNHNPEVQERKKRQEAEALRQKVMALLPGSKIKIKSGGSFYEVTLLSAIESSRVVEVQHENGSVTRVMPRNSS